MYTRLIESLESMRIKSFCRRTPELGIEIVFLNRAIGTSPEEDMLLQMQGMFSEYETRQDSWNAVVVVNAMPHREGL